MKKILILLLFCSCARYNQSIEFNSNFEVPATINGTVTVPFIVDTGASETTISSYVFMTLLKNTTITVKDSLCPKSFILANGSQETNVRVMLKSLKVGNTVFKNVEASVGNNIYVPLLIGQNVLKRMNRIEINYKTSKIKWYGKV